MSRNIRRVFRNVDSYIPRNSTTNNYEPDNYAIRRFPKPNKKNSTNIIHSTLAQKVANLENEVADINVALAEHTEELNKHDDRIAKLETNLAPTAMNYLPIDQCYDLCQPACQPLCQPLCSTPCYPYNSCYQYGVGQGLYGVGCGPCGPTVCGPCGPNACGPNVCGPCGPNVCGPAACGPNVCGPCGPNVCGPAVCGPCGPNVCGPCDGAPGCFNGPVPGPLPGPLPGPGCFNGPLPGPGPFPGPVPGQGCFNGAETGPYGCQPEYKNNKGSSSECQSSSDGSCNDTDSGNCSSSKNTSDYYCENCSKKSKKKRCCKKKKHQNELNDHACNNIKYILLNNPNSINFKNNTSNINGQQQSFYDLSKCKTNKCELTEKSCLEVDFCSSDSDKCDECNECDNDDKCDTSSCSSEEIIQMVPYLEYPNFNVGGTCGTDFYGVNMHTLYDNKVTDNSILGHNLHQPIFIDSKNNSNNQYGNIHIVKDNCGQNICLQSTEIIDGVCGNICPDIDTTIINQPFGLSNTNAKMIWATRISGLNITKGTSVKTDSSNNIIVVGTFGGDFSSSPVTNSTTAYNSNGTAGKLLVSSGTQDAFIIKYDANGYILWNARINGLAIDAELSVTIDASNNIIVVGSFGSSSINIYSSNDQLFKTLNQTGIVASFIVKYDSFGNALWANLIDSSNTIYLTSVAVDTQNNISVTGYYDGTNIIIYNSDNTTTTSLPASIGEDVLVIKYNSNGFAQWATKLGNEIFGSDKGLGIKNLPDHL